MAYEVKPADKPPVPQPRKGEGEMDRDELQATIAGVLTDCQTFIEQELSPERATATDYYLGKPFGNEEDGRSQVVLTEVRDSVQAVLPSLLKVFFGPERVVEFAPANAEDEATAQQATDYVQYVFAEDNAGFMLTHAVLKDGLVRKLGIFKWGWDDTTATKAYELTGVTQDQLEALAADDEIDLKAIVPHAADGDRDGDEAGDATDAAGGLFDVKLTRTTRDGRARVWTVPPEEFWFSREARTLEDALCVAHATDKTRGELVAMGVDPKVLDEHGGTDLTLVDGQENIARREASGATAGVDPNAGEANELIRYVEAYVYLDVDGDGVAELRKICTVGPQHHVVANDPVDERPFAVYCPDPEPHTMVGLSWADRTMDMQRIKSSVARSTLDSAAASIFPRTAYVEGQVNVADILNTEIGAPIRMRAPGMAQPFTTPFLGQQMFPILEYLDDVVERRTGQNKGAMGLDADALQSSTSSAVGAAVTAAQAQTEMLARIFAEMTLKPLFKGLLRLLVAHQPRARMVRLRNQWQAVDPRPWNADMDATVNVALGSLLVEQKVAALLSVAEKQEQIFATLGPANPLVTLAKYRETLARILSLQGFKDTEAFFNVVPPDYQPPPPATPPDPSMMLAQLEAQKAQIAAAQKDKELMLRAQELQFNVAAREREMQQQFALAQEKLQAEMSLKVQEMELKYQAQINEAVIAARVQAALDTQKIQAEHERTAAKIDAEDRRAERESVREHERETQRIANEREATQATQSAPAAD